ncbi:MAG TPA: ABC transporter ATP-binding protein [Candidatus Obscuribacter sp.]|nr:ABC transporter ATP-binding protein [Candidatus Obscuribacter sp.]HNH88213.1 ABC transporter ATP-binding protein [Thiobacillaceae bacterium]HNI06693.1 ABC transporter ATP-binding protein [Thiobacillaceae bacterium]
MIELRNLTKSYLTDKGKHYVFRDLSCRFPDGVSIGLIGRNGAGKSTLMRLLGGIDVPDSGEVVVEGSVSWPVGLAGGFQQSLSARDNIKFVCRIYGVSGSGMQEILEYVRDFAQIGDYFDQPMKSYSAGMRARVAFGLSMAFDFDYLLIDEVMAVGDADFKRKCKIAFHAKRKRSNLILVSHNMDDIARYCNAVLFVDGGKVRIFEDVKAGILAYQEPSSGERQTPVKQKLRKHAHRMAEA